MISSSEKAVAVLFLVILCVFTGFDLAEDYERGASFLHMAEELVVMGFAVFFLVGLWFRYGSLKTENVVLKKDLTQVRGDFDKFQKEARHHIEGLTHLIDRQFEEWSLSKSEKEVALLLLKGFSAKEIADIRGSSVKTISQQCSDIYSKSGLSNRAELAAFFLEDLFLPPTASSRTTAAVK